MACFDDDYSLLREGEEEPGASLPQAGHLQERPPCDPRQVCQVRHYLVQDHEVDQPSPSEIPDEGADPAWVPDPAAAGLFSHTRGRDSKVSPVPEPSSCPDEQDKNRFQRLRDPGNYRE